MLEAILSKILSLKKSTLVLNSLACVIAFQIARDT